MGGTGSGGKNKKPTAQKKREGNPGHRKLNPKEPKVSAGEPAIPGYLNVRARAIWNRLVPRLIEMQVLTRADGEALGLLCSSLAQVALADAAIEKYGLILATIDKETGVSVMRVNPAVRIKSDSMRQARAALSTFGLDPASRSKLTVADLTPAPGKDAIARMMEEGDNDEIVH